MRKFTVICTEGDGSPVEMFSCQEGGSSYVPNKRAPDHMLEAAFRTLLNVTVEEAAGSPAVEEEEEVYRSTMCVGALE